MSGSAAKVALRRQIRAQRDAIAPLQRQRASTSITKRLTALPIWQQAGVIASYIAINNEIDPSGVDALALASDKRLVYPRAQAGGGMTFHSLEAPHCERGPGGVLQSTADAPVCTPHEIDLILIPLLACDSRGHRLGYGGGYYDRFLPMSPAVRMGLGYEWQLTAEVPTDEYDQRLDYFISDEGLRSFDRMAAPSGR